VAAGLRDPAAGTEAKPYVVLARSWRTRITIIRYMRSGTHVFALVLVGCGGFLLFLEMEGLNVLAWPSRQSSEMPEQTNQLKLELTRARIMNEQLKTRVAELSATPSPTSALAETTSAWSSDLLRASDRISFVKIADTVSLEHGGVPFWVAVENSLDTIQWVLNLERGNVDWWAGAVHAAKAKHGRCRALDVGSNSGFYSLLSRSMGCSVLAVDAQPRCVHRLASAAAVNGFARGLDTRWAAVSNNPGEVEAHSDKCSGLWSARNKSKENRSWLNDSPNQVAEPSVVVFAKKASMPELLAGWLPPGEHIDVMKIDTEGHEFEILISTLPYLKERRVHKIMFEVLLERHTTAKEEIARITGELYDLGYVCGPLLRGGLYSKATLISTFLGDDKLSDPDWLCSLSPGQGAIWNANGR
jgi:FkbM family methyltransferase